MAAREATMSVYRFAKAIEGIRESFRYLPTLRPLVRHDIIRVPVKLYDAQFPNYWKVRNLSVQSTEFASLSAAKQNVSRASPVRENLSGRKFFSSINGRFISSEVSSHLLRAL